MTANRGILRLLLASSLVCAWGCISTRPAPLSEVSADQFTLILEADWDAVGRGLATELVHRLSNRSDVAVCVGGSWKLRIGGEGILVVTTMDALCSSPVIVVEPGREAEWTSTIQLGHCVEKSDPGFRALLPLRCGAELELDVEIALFRWSGKAPEWGVTYVLSAPVPVTRIEDGAASETQDGGGF